MALKIRRVAVRKVEDLSQHMKRIYVQGNNLSLLKGGITEKVN